MLGLAGLLIWSLLPGGAERPESPTAFVNARLNRSACSWLQIVNVTPAQGGGERVALAGIAASPTAVQAGLMRRAMDANIPLAEIDVSDVATGPNETCAQIELLRQYRWSGRSRLTVIPPRGALAADRSYGWSGRFEFEVEMQGLPPHAALLGLDSVGGLEVLIPDLHAFRREQPPLRTTGTRVAYTGHVLRRESECPQCGPDPDDLVRADRRGDRPADRPQRRPRRAGADRPAARGQQWQFELALVRCGFEGGQRRQC